MFNTINYYNNNSKQLIFRYESADMLSLHKLLLKHIPTNSSVLDIGFGSGRDLSFLYKHGCDIWGIDPAIEFVNNLKLKYPEKKDHFFIDVLPFKAINEEIYKHFNAVISIATLMHLKRSEYKDSVKSITDVCKDSSVVIISFSSGSRKGETQRYFEEVDAEYLNALFLEKDFRLIDSVSNKDSLDRDELEWTTVVYKND